MGTGRTGRSASHSRAPPRRAAAARRGPDVDDRGPPRWGKCTRLRSPTHWTNSVDRSYSNGDICGAYHVPWVMDMIGSNPDPVNGRKSATC